MKFRPCIDIHNGKVKQIVGSTLSDMVVLPGENGDKEETAVSTARENYVSSEDGAFFGKMYREMNLPGGHIILLNPAGTEEYEKDVEQAELALSAFPDGLMIGGGITAENAERFLDMGATHVIVTSYVFKNGKVDMDRLEKLRKTVGRERLVLDLSCRRQGDDYYIVTDRWQKFTDVKLNVEALEMFREYADEFLIHAVDVEGKAGGIEKKLAELLGDWGRLPVTYAGGVGSFEDLDTLKKLGRDRLDVTIGSALSIFGGSMDLKEVLEYINS
ncbi:1-(5-phosphoribosyl)-5-[(5-phosphoribosylamino)methylideneamino] imidazole-4-carboxamide isomerase [Eubacterium ruminantium]|nr:1-(5-phosphoribosyl)-5-[(5-phosphoribosylamino)methylideneamino] imidazole-4-carboxamide isomerase [Eubacterium ruminantium]